MLTIEQQRAIELIANGKNVFIYGSAGTGKSFLINKIKSIFNPVITASTGIAAILIGGSTLHSFAGIGINFTMNDMHRIPRRAIARWSKVKMIVIDEVSMLSARYLEVLNEVVQRIRKNPFPFGGIQVILSGDFLQLPPVYRDFLFESEIWDEFKFEYVELTKTFRQNNIEFISILNKIRIGNVDESVLSLSKYVREPDIFDGIIPTILYPHRASVQQLNNAELMALEANEGYKIYEYKASHKTYRNNLVVMDPDDKYIYANLQCEQVLKLAIGAQVMCTKNKPDFDIVNGSRGTVTYVSDDIIRVKFLHLNNPIDIDIDTFEVKYDDCMVIVTQYPLILAWALTIHKCQGSTLDCVQVDLSEAFDFGMIYVALSRVKSPDGLYLIDINYTKIKAYKKAIEFYKKIGSIIG